VNTLNKQRKKPELKVLNMNITIFGINGDFTDAAFHDNNNSNFLIKGTINMLTVGKKRFTKHLD